MITIVDIFGHSKLPVSSNPEFELMILSLRKIVGRERYLYREKEREDDSANEKGYKNEK